MESRFVVTLPPDTVGLKALRFAGIAREQGAQLLELRTDLHADGEVDVTALARELPLFVSERGRKLPRQWVSAATEVDRSLDSPAAGTSVASYHSERPMTSDQALAFWSKHAVARAGIKHVEPLGSPSAAVQLFETQRRLLARFGEGHVTVLATGPLALAFRCLLAQRNAFDYLALDDRFLAAEGQRFLAVAQRERTARRDGTAGPRHGILGSRIAESRSPLFHRQPFDRIDLPPDTELGPILEVLHPFYEGFAVTSPFKKTAAQLVSAKLPAINTLVRQPHGWLGDNTDVDGAVAALKGLKAREVTVLGDGGATAALRVASGQLGMGLTVLRQRDVTSRPLSGTLIWTWPAALSPPTRLRFARAKVAVIAYGAQALLLGREIRKRGGSPVQAGSRWFSAQAHRQAQLWSEAR